MHVGYIGSGQLRTVAVLKTVQVASALLWVMLCRQAHCGSAAHPAACPGEASSNLCRGCTQGCAGAHGDAADKATRTPRVSSCNLQIIQLLHAQHQSYSTSNHWVWPPCCDGLQPAVLTSAVRLNYLAVFFRLQVCWRAAASCSVQPK